MVLTGLFSRRRPWRFDLSETLVSVSLATGLRLRESVNPNVGGVAFLSRTGWRISLRRAQIDIPTLQQRVGFGRINNFHELRPAREPADGDRLPPSEYEEFRRSGDFSIWHSEDF